jgi:hypothetical protein
MKTMMTMTMTTTVMMTMTMKKEETGGALGGPWAKLAAPVPRQRFPRAQASAQLASSREYEQAGQP